ncbi:MAG: hypothetical protein R3E31_19140 [Chloroflexota bacterium]
MRIYSGTTREIGRLYETGRYLHNYALTYALELAVAPLFSEQMPRYAEQLTPLNERHLRYPGKGYGRFLRAKHIQICQQSVRM